MDLAVIGQITFSRNFDNNWKKNVNFRQIFKIILINDDSFLQMYRSEMNFLTYWFLKMRWFFAKSVKITKEIAIHKNGLLQSFWKNPVCSSVNLSDEHDHFFFWPYLHWACFVSNILEKRVDLTTLNIMRITRAMLMIFSVFCLIQQTFPREKVNGNTMKR